MKTTLPFSQKLAYAVGGLALNFANMLISQWLLRLYVPSLDNALVAPALFSVIFLAGRLIDGLSDPLVGYLSDHCRSRYGRRKPFIAASLLPVAIVSGLMWLPPMAERSWVNGVFIFVLVQLFFILWTILANPYSSMLPELSRDRKERVDIATLHAVFLMIGTVLSALIGPIKDRFGWPALGILVFGITLISFLPVLLFVKTPATNTTEKIPPKEHSPLKMARWMASTFKNRPFVWLLSSTSLFWFALNLMILLIPFWVEHLAGRSDSDVLLVMGPYIGANILAFFPVNLASKKWGKKPVFLAGLLGSALACLFLSLAGKIGISVFLHTQIAIVIFGVTTAPFIALPNALLADAVDLDEKSSGERREAIHYGTQAFFQKVAIGLSVSLSGALMFIGGNGTPGIMGLRLIAIAAGILALLAALAFSRWNLRETD